MDELWYWALAVGKAVVFFGGALAIVVCWSARQR